MGLILCKYSAGTEYQELITTSNWKGGHTYNDKFNIIVSGTSVTVVRLDSDSGWGMNLQFVCVLGGQCAETDSTACHPWGSGANTKQETIDQCGPKGSGFAQYADCAPPLLFHRPRQWTWLGLSAGGQPVDVRRRRAGLQKRRLRHCSKQAVTYHLAMHG